MTRDSLSLDLADWALGLRYEDLPPGVVADVKLRVLDSLGLIISGAATPMGRAVHAASGGLGSGRRARLIPTGKRTSAPTAALAHGTQAHAEDFDDTHNESIMHSSAPVTATVLALGESVRASGREAIVLVAAGNELNCRLGCAAPGSFHDHGFHPTSVLGSIASAILAARMLGLDACGAAHAAGIAGSYCAAGADSRSAPASSRAAPSRATDGPADEVVGHYHQFMMSTGDVGIDRENSAAD